jgi:hypothetical protein
MGFGADREIVSRAAVPTRGTAKWLAAMHCGRGYARPSRIEKSLKGGCASDRCSMARYRGLRKMGWARVPVGRSRDRGALGQSQRTLLF